MANSTRQPALRIDIPTLEPDAVLLERLVAASASSTPSPGTPWLVGLRAALVAVVVALLGVTTWAAGALAGVDTPFDHREIQHAPLVPTAPTGVTGSPQSDDSSSGGPASSGLPDARGTARGRSAGHRQDGNAPSRRGQHGLHRGPGPVTDAPWPGLGLGHHYGWGKNRGRHQGQQTADAHSNRRIG